MFGETAALSLLRRTAVQMVASTFYTIPDGKSTSMAPIGRDTAVSRSKIHQRGGHLATSRAPQPHLPTILVSLLVRRSPAKVCQSTMRTSVDSFDRLPATKRGHYPRTGPTWSLQAEASCFLAMSLSRACWALLTAKLH